MPDFTNDPLKFNPPVDGSGIDQGDWSGYVLAGGPRGLIGWESVGTVLGAFQDANPTDLLNHILGTARFTSSDAAGVYGIGSGSKQASGSNSSEPVQVFPWVPSVIPASVQVKVGNIYVTNNVAYSGTIEAGFYKVAFSGSSQMVYTLSETGKVVESHSGLAAHFLTGSPASNRRSDLDLGGNQSWALGVKLSAAPPSGCIIDASVSIQLSAS